MTAGEGQHRRERVSRVAPCVGKALAHIVTDRLWRKRRKGLRHSLLEQGPARIGEESLHRRWSRSGEHVGGSLALMLDDTADLSIGAVDGENVLYLVEDDQATDSRALV